MQNVTTTQNIINGGGGGGGGCSPEGPFLDSYIEPLFSADNKSRVSTLQNL